MNLRRCKISRYKQVKLLELFVAEVTARTAAELAGVNRRTATLFYHKLRKIICWYIEEEWQFSGEIEVEIILWRRSQRKAWNRHRW